MNGKAILISVAGTIGGISLGPAAELESPVKLIAGGNPIDVQRTGHSAPFVGDFDGDGLHDLLVGEFHEGRLRIYRNTGSNREPEFDQFEWFTAGGELGRVPTS